MALTGNKIDLILGLKLNEFFAANKRAAASYSKTKGSIEGKPIRIREDGTANLLRRLTQIGVAYIGIRKVFSDLTTSQTNLANVASLGVENIQELGAGIDKIGLDVPVALHDIEQGLYQVVSAGVDASEQINVLEQSARAAKAGLAETTDSLNLGSAVIKGYGKEWDEFGDVMDQAFQTVKLGQTTFPELAANIGQVVPLASTLKVETQELFGAFATLTGVTGNTSEVATQLRGILAATAKPTKELTELFKDYGGASKALQELGLAQYLKVIADETGGNSEAMAKLVPRVEGLNAVLALSGKQFDTFIEKTNAMRDASGSMGEAFDKQAETLDSKLTLLDNSFQIFSRTILTGVVPAMTTMLDLGNSFFKWFVDLDEGTQKALLGLTGLSVVLVKLPGIIRTVQVAIAGLNASLGPAGWLVVGLGAFAAIVLTAHDNLVKLNEQFDKLNAGIKELTLAEVWKEYIELQDELNKKQAEGILITKEEADRLNFLAGSIANLSKDNNDQVDLTAKKYKFVNGELVEIIEKIDEINDKSTNPPTPKAITGFAKGPGQPIDPVAEKARELELQFQIETEFRDLNNQELEREYFFRTNLVDRALEYNKNKWGEESRRYQEFVELKLQLDRNYTRAKAGLEQESVETSIGLGAELMTAFNGQSKALFEIGKVAAVADAILNTYKGVSETLAAYPYPFNLAPAALHLALGLAQVAKVKSVKYQAKGKASGGYIFASDLVPGYGIGIPPNEDGLIAAQIGETVMNRNATKLFAPVLNAMNAIGNGRAKGYQTGGVVTGSDSGLNSAVLAGIMEDSIIKAFSKSSLRLRGDFRAKGKDLKSSIDKTEELTVRL